MPSSKERARWELWYAQIDARMKRQKRALDRMALALIESTAALEEISALDPVDKEGFNKALMRSKEALDRMRLIAAAGAQKEEESEGEEDPIDPRRNHGA